MTIFCCPNCGRPLAREPHRLACPAGHSFDLAKSGYVNLLLSHGAGPKRHGDDKRMVKARSTFLQKGHYAPMRQELLRRGLLHRRPGRAAAAAGPLPPCRRHRYLQGGAAGGRQARPPKRICRCQLFPSSGGRRQRRPAAFGLCPLLRR